MPTNSLLEEQIFQAARRIESVDARRAYLEEACGDDAQLRDRIGALLMAYEEQESFLESPATDIGSNRPTALFPVTEQPGTQIGPYKLLQQIGEGGMGVVYMAEQIEPLERRVALKIIKPGMDTQQVIARFEAERQALAMMEHPNIAKAIDAGVTDTGRPYFVMELVKGVPITEYCDEHQLSTRERLELFVPVCQAIQHAHQKGIIHRDIKPSNVLIADYDDRPVPKVIDFGVAKAMDRRLTEKTMFTEFGQVLGTFEYMSPEQAKLNQWDVDTRSDIYSLGVLLYELLSGETPFDRQRLRSEEIDELFRVIREEEPPRPSMRLSTSESLPTIAANRKTEPKKLNALVHGELDWIVMKSLEKDRTRRYETASKFAEDVQHYLNDEPVEACPPSTVYRLRKSFRRNRRTIVRAATALTLLMLVSLAGVFARKHYEGRSDLKEQQVRSELREREIERVQQETRRARGDHLPSLERLVASRDYVAAFELAKQIELLIPDDPQLKRLQDKSTHQWTIVTDPPGASVYWKDYKNPDAAWRSLGQSPLTGVQLPNELLLWRVTLEDHQEVIGCRSPRDDRVSFTLDQANKVPAEMVRVTGELPEFFIDRCEVTNRQYQSFVDAGGYRTRMYWTAKFLRDGTEESWEEAVKTFVDSTHQSGPANWIDGKFSPGTADFPVTGVTWYEAAAYAEFVGKSLPTLLHWRQAAGIQYSAAIARQSNFRGDSVREVGSQLGAGPFGTSDMAGNVQEWCWNQVRQAEHVVIGGDWKSYEYVFNNDWGSRKSFLRSAQVGFRCVTYLAPPTKLTLASIEKRAQDSATPVPVSDEVFSYFKTIYEPPRKPLNAKLTRVSKDAENWIQETIAVDVAYRDERCNMHLFLPRDARPPFQVVVYFPSANSFRTSEPLNSLKLSKVLRDLVKGGRAVLWPIYDFTHERNRGVSWKNAEWLIHASQDLKRAVDYLHTRSDIDHGRIGYLGASLGSCYGPIFLTQEDRFRAAVFLFGGFTKGIYQNRQPHLSAENYAPRVEIPVLMLNGRSDEVFDLETSQQPLYQLLRSPSQSKSHILFEGGHAGFPTTPDTSAWFDLYLGEVTEQDERKRLLTQANFAASRGDWEQAASFYRQATRSRSSEGLTWMRAAVCLLMSGDREGFEELARKMLAAIAEGGPIECEQLTRACLLAPDVVDVADLPVRQLADSLDDGKATPIFLSSCELTLGLASYRQGEFRQAIEYAKRSGSATVPAIKVTSDIILAMAHRQLGEVTLARQELAAAKATLDFHLHRDSAGKLDHRSIMTAQNLKHDWLIAELLFQEARSLIETGGSDPSEAPDTS